MLAMKVLGQRLVCEMPDALASGQVDFASFRFEFSPDWDNLDKTAQFTQDGTTYNMHLGTGTPLTCYMPAEITDGIVYVSVFGLLEGEPQIATTAPLRLRVARSGYGDGVDGDSGLTPTLYAQLLEELDAKIAEIYDDIADAVTAYLEEHPVEGITAEQCTEMIADALADYIKSEDLDSAITAALADYVKSEDLTVIIADALADYVKSEDLTVIIADALADYVKSEDLTVIIADALADYVKSEDLTVIIADALADYVKSEDGKGLSSNDYTDAEKAKLASIEEGATAITVDSALSSTSTNPVENKAVYAALAKKVDTSLLGVAGGVATLDGSGLVPSTQLPSYVDDVIEGYLYNGVFYEDSTHKTAITGESGKIYVDLSTNYSYRYSGSGYVQITSTDLTAITNSEIDSIMV